MFYPVLMTLPGLWLLMFSVTGHPNPVVMVGTALGCLLSLLLQSWRLFGVVLLAGVIAGVIVGEPNIIGIAIGNGLGYGLAAIGTSVRCPRCTYSVMPARLWHGEPGNRWCPMCGRDRKGVHAFQYARKPEPWDGCYHDEGGGPGSEDGIMDWYRDILYRRLIKRRNRA